MSILDEYNHGSNGYHGYNSVIRHSEHPSHRLPAMLPHSDAGGRAR